MGQKVPFHQRLGRPGVRLRDQPTPLDFLRSRFRFGSANILHPNRNKWIGRRLLTWLALWSCFLSPAMDMFSREQPLHFREKRFTGTREARRKASEEENLDPQPQAHQQKPVMMTETCCSAADVTQTHRKRGVPQTIRGGGLPLI